LDVADNSLTELPEELGRCLKLAYLDVRGNEISNVPQRYERLHSMQTFELDLKYFGAMQLLPFDYRLYGEPSVDFLLRGAEGVSRFYKAMHKSSESRSLLLSGLRLTSFPIAACSLHDLAEIDLSDNLLKSVPNQISNLSLLRVLDLTGNPLERLPPSISKMVYSLDLKYGLRLPPHPLKNCPEECTQDGKRAMLHYYVKVMEAQEMVMFKTLVMTGDNMLQIAGLKMSKLPADLFDLVPIQAIDLSGNLITELPSSISILTNLTSLKLEDNAIAHVTPAISSLKSLQFIDLRANPLSYIPLQFGHLDDLTAFEIESRLEAFFPSEWRQMGVASLRKFLKSVLQVRVPRASHWDLENVGLEALVFSVSTVNTLRKRGRRTGVPKESMCELFPGHPRPKNFKQSYWLHWGAARDVETRYPLVMFPLAKVKRLVLDGNMLSVLPPSIGLLTNLTSLSAKSNRIETLSVMIRELVKLKTLDLSRNQLHRLPLRIGWLTNLTSMQLSDNNLREIPYTIGDCSALTLLDVSLNFLKAIPEEIGSLGTVAELNLAGNRLATLPQVPIARIG
jgi:Leucine-rich repeat (LRR) protein